MSGLRALLPWVDLVDAGRVPLGPQPLAFPGECHDPEHRGLDRLVRDFPAIEPGDTSCFGPGVEVLYLEKQRLLEENRDLRLGRAEYRSTLRSSVCIGFACGVAFLYALAVLLGGRPW